MAESSKVQGGRRRRTHSAEFKAQAVAAAQVKGVSLAGVALERGINPNLLRRWCEAAGMEPTWQRRRARSVKVKAASLPAAAFVPAVLSAPVAGPALAASTIRIEVQRAGASVAVHWPLAAAGECAAWLQGWLR